LEACFRAGFLLAQKTVEMRAPLSRGLTKAKGEPNSACAAFHFGADFVAQIGAP
jgi:hypothetical protein